jgi:ankyrin repeat protein
MIKTLMKVLVVRMTKPTIVIAAREADLATVQRLLANGEDVDATDGYGRTALMEACRGGSNCLVRILLEHGADPFRKSRSNKNSFAYALNDGVYQILFASTQIREAEYLDLSFLNSVAAT